MVMLLATQPVGGVHPLEAFLWGLVFAGSVFIFAFSVLQLVMLRKGERRYGVGIKGPGNSDDFPQFPPDADYELARGANGRRPGRPRRRSVAGTGELVRTARP